MTEFGLKMMNDPLKLMNVLLKMKNLALNVMDRGAGLVHQDLPAVRGEGSSTFRSSTCLAF